MAAERGSSFGAEQNAGLAAVADDVLADEVVGVAVADRNPLAFDVEDRVLLGQPEFHAPAEEEADLAAFEFVPPHDGPLRTRTRVQAQPRVIVAVTVLDRHVVADLPTDAVAVVIPRRDLPDQHVAHVLQEDAATVVAVEVLVVLAVAVERELLDDEVLRLFARHEREERRAGRVARRPEVLPQGAIQFEAVARAGDQRSLENFGPAVVRILGDQRYAIADLEALGIDERDLLVVPVRIESQLRRDRRGLGEDRLITGTQQPHTRTQMN